jgi:flavin reductase (DIM6/NTAB) family NADH-FMN oxidoreductase RutF
MPFTKIGIKDIRENVFELIGDKWMLITGGDKDGFNTMTASWGGAGILWQKAVTFCFVRPQRYTRKFMDYGTYFSLSFFGEKYRDALFFCGSKSGRDIDKVKETGLTPYITDCGAVCFEEAELVLVCRKIYFHDMDPENFLAPEIAGVYENGDYHRMYVGEIIEVLAK